MGVAMNAVSVSRLHAVGFTRLPRDVNGIPDGPDYETFLKVDDMPAQKSVRAGECGIWSGRQHHLAGLDEINGFSRLEGNPFVLSIREGYPLFADEVLQNAIARKPNKRGNVMTIDFVLTLAPHNFGGPLRYMGISQKKEYVKRTEAGIRRAKREEHNLGRVGWLWNYLAQPKPENAATVFNHELLGIWATSPHDESIDVAEQRSSALASALYQTTSTKPLGSLLPMLGCRLGIQGNLQFYVFACAYYFGYIGISHAEKLSLDRPLKLLPPARKFGGGYVRR